MAEVAILTFRQPKRTTLKRTSGSFCTFYWKACTTVYSFSSLRTRAEPLVSFTLSCCARSTMSFLFRAETLCAISAEYRLLDMSNTSSSWKMTKGQDTRVIYLTQSKKYRFSTSEYFIQEHRSHDKAKLNNTTRCRASHRTCITSWEDSTHPCFCNVLHQHEIYKNYLQFFCDWRVI